MNNFKEIADKCLKGELSGRFILRSGGRLYSSLLSRTNNKDFPYRLDGFSYHSNGCYVSSDISDIDIINFTPDMEERNVKLTLEKAKEWYKKGGELKEVALQAYTEEELKKDWRPKSWEEYTTQMREKPGFYISARSDIKYVECNRTTSQYDRNLLPTKELAGAFRAYMQVMSLYKAWIEEWEPDWLSSDQPKFCIEVYANHLTVGENYNIKSGLPFPSYELAKDFLNTFRDLIEKTKPLL